MTCQHCQTWILDDDHRCSRCGRRVRNTPARISPETYPIAATATAPAYAYSPSAEPIPVARAAVEGPRLETGQQALFATAVSDVRVIPFDSLATHAQRESIRARAAELARPAPLRTERVEAPRARSRKPRLSGQRRLDFTAHQDPIALPSCIIACDAPVAPTSLRVKAALIDMAVIAAGCALIIAIFRWQGIEIPLRRSVIPFFVMAMVTVPLFYKVLWTWVGRDSIGMQRAGLQLVDFDGNPPSQSRRYQRLLGSVLSFLAAGVGVLWALFDEDGLTWHDHISSTFPTIIAED